jgi:hypothetical protein
MLALAVLLAAASPLPPEIQAYYRDHNFVRAFSTMSERRLVAERRQPVSGDRLERVAAAMTRLAERTAVIDPAFVRSYGPTEAVLRADLVRVTSFEPDTGGGEAWVHLESLRLDPRGNTMLIAKYDELTEPGRQPTVDELLAVANRPPVRSFEIHRWRWVGGTWRRDIATRHFLSR